MTVDLSSNDFENLEPDYDIIVTLEEVLLMF